MIDAASIRRVPLFRDFGDQEVAGVAATITDRTYTKHEFVVREGDPGSTFFFLVKGSVSVCRIMPDGREMILAILKEGDFFGEMAMFDSSLRSASIKALTDVEVGAIRHADFLIFLDRDPHIGRALVIALLNLADQFGERVDNGTRISLRLTNQELANMIATTRETVNRTLNRFWDEKLLDMRTTHVVVVDPERLRSLVP